MEHTHFAIGRQSQRLGGSVALAGLLEIALVVLAVAVSHYHRAGVATAKADEHRTEPALVWLADSRPGGGGGGGGNHMQQPPRAAELVGHDKVSVPVRQAPATEPARTLEPDDVVPQITIPALTTASALQDLSGAIAAPGLPSASRGPGDGPGAGSGKGLGDGPGIGDGLGPGLDHGTNGGPFNVGGDVLPPRELSSARPVYTAEAMRARIQGSVVVECIVQPSGVCTDIQIERSLDRTFGLDQAAVDSVKRWKFRPGTRRGQAVPVLVRIEVDFTIR